MHTVDVTFVFLITTFYRQCSACICRKLRIFQYFTSPFSISLPHFSISLPMFQNISIAISAVKLSKLALKHSWYSVPSKKENHQLDRFYRTLCCNHASLWYRTWNGKVYTSRHETSTMTTTCCMLYRLLSQFRQYLIIYFQPKFTSEIHAIVILANTVV